ncbi:hypothetical protein LQT97_09720 [Brucella pseudogrignonensis]|uniref:hypothetical protein n=1 Tax=Brucella pseudogrignonensis TaxID=419475 RepID=UPI001E41AB0E|nr:hypothetical protein [Brucella pseudogrignonensis]MCD4511515.1 hypothetical protein [Brucella pseudogrignonensis]
MLEIEHLLILIDGYKNAIGLQDKTVSSRIFGDSKKVTSLRSGGDLTVSRLNAAMRWLSTNWPDGLVWPVAIFRPETVSPDYLPSGVAGARRSPAGCAPASNSGNAVAQ